MPGSFSALSNSVSSFFSGSVAKAAAKQMADKINRTLILPDDNENNNKL